MSLYLHSLGIPLTPFSLWLYETILIAASQRKRRLGEMTPNVEQRVAGCGRATGSRPASPALVWEPCELPLPVPQLDTEKTAMRSDLQAA